MDVKTVVFCILIAQSSASFFDDFRGAMSSVENSFGKLIDDVVTDVRDTIECTVLAVKQVLGFDGYFRGSSEYDARCRGINPAPTYTQPEQEVYYPPPPPVILATTKAPTVFNVKSIPEVISEHIGESAKSLNQHIDFIEKSDTHEKINHVTNSLLRESNRLADISSVLKRELTSISKDVKMELGKLESDTDNPHVQGIWKEIKDLHSIELSHKNTPEAKVIHNILDDILSVLRGNSKRSESTEKPPSMDLDNTFKQIETQFLEIEKEESEQLNIVQDIIKEDLPVETAEIEKDAQSIMDKTSKTLSLSENTQFVTNTPEVTTTTKIEDDPLLSPEYADLFQITSQDSQSHEDAVRSAQELIEQSKQTEALMESLFKQSNVVGYDLFDTPGLFG